MVIFAKDLREIVHRLKYNNNINIMTKNTIKKQFQSFFQISAGKVTIAALLLGLPVAADNLKSQERLHQIIPQPLNMEIVEGQEFVLTPKTPIFYTSCVKAQAEYLQEVFAGSTGYDLVLKEGKGKKGISIDVDPSVIAKAEGYRLTVSAKGISIVAHDAAGAFYGIQTLLQMFPAEIHSVIRHKDVEWTVAPVVVEDAPNRPWRGMMIDVARYFYDKDFVKKYIDMMAMYKLNKLQFHFIDDSGWRLEIKKYPRLTEVGAWAGPDHNRLGGFYTQEDIQEIVAYAAVRGVEVIPEIEFPAHMLSAVVAYPWLSCTGLQHEVPTQHFISRDILCVGKESSIQFLRDVLDETVKLFPSKYINIGGDEARYDRWSTCPKCQEVMKREGLKNPSELQGYLTNVVAEMMKEKGKTVTGWQEIISRGKINTPVVSVVWLNARDTIQAKNLGHKAILTPCTHMYYDFPESNIPGEVKAATWMPPVSLERTYSTPLADYSEKSTVLGVQACYWSDQFIHGTMLQEIPYLDENRSENYAEYLTFPRLLALSEVAWGKEANRNFKDFQKRLSHHYGRLDNKGCNYRVPQPIVTSLKEEGNHNFTYELTSPVEGAELVYTTDGSYPTVHSKKYTGPVTVEHKNDFRAMTVVNSRHYSLPLYTAPDYSAYKQFGTYCAEWKPLQIQLTPTNWRFECTGKISGNGDYEVTFIRTRGANALNMGTLKLFKRDTQMAEVEQTGKVTENGHVTYTFNVDDFEAGTPFFIDVMVNGEGGNDTTGFVFIKKK